jgi:hypothetical protein
MREIFAVMFDEIGALHGAYVYIKALAISPTISVDKSVRSWRKIDPSLPKNNDLRLFFLLSEWGVSN